MDKSIYDIYNMLQEIAWHFGNRGFEEECCEDLTLVEFMALKKVCDNKCFSIQEIGSALNFTKSGATRIIDRLENKEYVRRERSPIDGRVCCVTVTGKGKSVISKVTGQYTAYLEEMLMGLEPRRVESIKDALETLAELIQRQETI
jgi:DNA-binding MarR family transcriptional regulator